MSAPASEHLVARTPLQDRLTDPMQAVALWLGVAVFRAMPPHVASSVGAWLARTIGPLLPHSNRARRNLRHVMPELSEAEIARIVRGTWANHGHVFGEMPHVERMIANGDVFAQDDAVQVLRDAKADGRPIVFLGGHLANFELWGAMTASLGFPITAIYRAPNNPRADHIWRRLRGSVDLVPKSPAGARRALQVLAQRGNLALLIDQKFNEGIEVPFMGKPAMTTPAPALFASRFKATIIFGWSERVGPARYQVFAEVVEPVLPTEKTTRARNAAILATTERINQHLERRVRERPADWFWMHRRWGKI